MGNSQPSQNSRSFSDDMIGHGPIHQRPHASSEVLPYNYQHHNRNNNNNNHAHTPQPLFSPKHHYNHINGLNGITYRPKLENNNSDSSVQISRMNSDSISTSHNTKLIIIEGWLTKRGESSKKLKKRYWKLYDNGSLKYNTKPTGSFKKYADLKVGIDNMILKDDLGFEVNVSKRHLEFFAETKQLRDQWFANIYKNYFEKGKEKVKLLARSSTDRDTEAKDKFVMNTNNNIKHKITKKLWKTKVKRNNSFDSTKAALKRKNKTTKVYRHASTPPVKQRSQSTVQYKNGNKGDGMIIFSEKYIHTECDGKTCLGLERVHYVLKKYDLWIRKENKIQSLGMYKYINNGLGEYYNNTHLLNDFNHLHEFHDNIFNHIYEYFDGECNYEQCLLVKRLHRDRNYYKNDSKRNQIYYNYSDCKEISTQQILDKIHCYYRHSYDLGFRVKKSKLLSIANNARNHRKWRTNSMNIKNNKNLLVGKKQISTNSITNEESKEAQMIIMQNDPTTDCDEEEQELDENDNSEGELEDPHGFEDEWKLLEICGLIQQKRWNLTCLRGNDRMNKNKFISKVCKSKRYHYWNKYDDDDDKQWQINMKYNDFKTEILSNSLYFISLKQWEILNEKALNHFQMNKSKKIRPHKYWAELYDLPKDNMGSFSITKSHLVAIMLYCNFDMLQRQFAETFYKLTETESDGELRKRHSNFYHYGRLLRELIECFGKKIYNKNIVFYHGITDQLMRIETSMLFHAPLSTTTSIEVAIAYAQHENNSNNSTTNTNDLLLELMDDDRVLGMARYFDCVWLSDFGNECEKYFIGGYKPLKIHTVLDATLGRNYINYLKALHIIDEMIQGYYFDTENEEIKQIILRLLQEQITNHKKKQINDGTPTAINKELLNEIKKLNTKENVNTNNNNNNNKIYMGPLNDEIEQDYDANKVMDEIKQNEIESDIHSRKISRKISEQFYHTRALSTIDMEEYDYFNEIPKYITKLVDYYCQNVTNIVIDWTNMTDDYISKLLCINDNQYQWIKLNVFLTLFPNLKELNVRNIKLSNYTIKDIHKFLSKAKENNKYNELYRIEIFEVDQTQYPISKCLNEYLDKFKDVGWTITFNPFEDEMCILKIITNT